MFWPSEKHTNSTPCSNTEMRLRSELYSLGPVLIHLMRLTGGVAAQSNFGHCTLDRWSDAELPWGCVRTIFTRPFLSGTDDCRRFVGSSLHGSRIFVNSYIELKYNFSYSYINRSRFIHLQYLALAEQKSTFFVDAHSLSI